MMPTPIYYQTTVIELLHKPMLRRVTKMKEESPYKPETFDSRSKRVNAHVVAHKDLQGSA
jgi:hypothetical protein